MLSNYPDGVTGNEPQIAGYPIDTDFRDDREVYCQNDECKAFEQVEEEEVVVEQWGGKSWVTERWEWTCPVCSHRTEFTTEFDPTPDDYDPYDYH